MYPNTERGRHELPPEVIDRIIDFLHDEPKALAACSLVARSWTATSRYHRFCMVLLLTSKNWAKFDRLIKISPTMVHYIRGITMDISDASSARWVSACTSFTSLEHITMFGAIIPPWQSKAAAISSVAHKVTSLTLNVTFVSSADFWPIIRIFPSLVSFCCIGSRSVATLPPPQSLPCYSPPISSISIATTATTGQGLAMRHLCDPPYPLTSLTALNISDVDRELTHGLQTLAETYASHISRLRLHVRAYSHECTSLRRFNPLPSC